MNRRLLLVAAGVVLVAAWFFLVWSPGVDRVHAAQAGQQAAEARATELTTQLVALRTSTARQPELVASLAQVRSAIPATPDLAPFLLDVDQAAAAVGIELKSLTPAEPTASTTGGPSEIHVTLNLEGGYGRTLDFMDRLLALPRLVVLDQVSVQPVDPKDPARLATTLTGRIFTTEVPPAAAPATTAPATTDPAVGR